MSMKIKINTIHNFTLIPESDADQAILRSLEGAEMAISYEEGAVATLYRTARFNKT
jgi:hypothetical protein